MTTAIPQRSRHRRTSDGGSASPPEITQRRVPRSDSVSGHLALEGGVLRGAVVSDGRRGPDAATGLLLLASGEFEFTPQLPDGFRPEMQQAVGPTLMEVARLKDEGSLAD